MNIIKETKINKLLLQKYKFVKIYWYTMLI